MKTGIIGAMHEEILLLKKDIQRLKTEQFGSREFHSGTIDGKEVVMALSGWGKVAAASTATTLINHYQVDQLVFIGLAGSIQAQLHIGDIVVANQLIQHDVDLSRLEHFPEVKSPFWKDFSFKVLPQSEDKALQAVETFLANLKKGDYPAISKEYAPQVHLGAIGTGDQFIASKDGKMRINERFPQILCTEMEGAAIAQVGADYQIPCTVIRVISDKADEQAHDAFAEFLFENISNISVEIAKLIL
ncbi:5'-methylthioadenosine/adenosylhomocysteine nucleosidase [Sunxiuqinia elliptica]|uniref:adenosylhomocysteine nucleosidase n=1 Tax=Sunxiuqinia elliptica TaxID=655355 RepID=A0A1I2BIH9_9BACT|nr:5'-methylthioadenosine/adenosylhomocysteine nucleosidase [Sunxiuqinia elliptica]SFE55063.1 adenosylhomocysteine nucleosidase [Sunxiuqinia elliptica]